MYADIVQNALTNRLALELNDLELYDREPSENRPQSRSQEWAVNREEYFARIQALIADDFKRVL